MKFDVDTITVANGRRVLEAGLGAIAAGDCQLDLSAVGRCDTAAVACVLAWTRAARASGASIAWLGVPLDLLNLCRLYRVQALIEG
jgi:phospholipid transport system transporter-binding protein